MIDQPVFRNPELLQELPYRKYLREHMPTGKQGFVVEDLDLLVRGYGNLFHTDSTGKFMLIELKYQQKWIDKAQENTFRCLHDILRKGDPEKLRYKGYFVVQYDHEDWEVANFKVNEQPVTRNEFFSQFLMFRNIEIEGLWE